MNKFFSIIFFISLSATGLAQSKKIKLLRYIRLVPLIEWTSSGFELTAKERDSIIADQLLYDSIAGYDHITKGTIYFLNREYPLFALFEARDHKDLLIQVNTAMRWISTTTIWQFDPKNKRLKDVTRSFGKKEPSIKSFLPDDFSFEGKDTLNKETDLQILCYPDENKLIYHIATDPMDTNNWINQAFDKNILLKWVGTWNGVKFIWSRVKDH